MVHRHIADAFSSFSFTLDASVMRHLERMRISFETRGQHPLALNSQLLGVHQMVFTDADRAEMFAIVGSSEKAVRAMIKHIPTINTQHKVASDPYNLICTWMLHLAFSMIEDEKQRHETLMNIALLLHYKLFTSLVNHFLPHKADERTMRATIDSLSRKSDIVEMGTWREVFHSRCADLISETSIHRHTLEQGIPDEKILYVITDVQTRIRDKVKNIFFPYIEMKEKGVSIGDRSSTRDDEGEKALVQRVSTFDKIISSMTTELMAVHSFVDHAQLALVSRNFKNISREQLRVALEMMVDLANVQAQSNELDMVMNVDGREVYVGMRALITNCVQKTFRYCINEKVDMSKPAAIFIKVRNVYSASRSSDPDILDVKASVAYLVDSIKITQRENSKAALRLAILFYIIAKAIKKL